MKLWLLFFAGQRPRCTCEDCTCQCRQRGEYRCGLTKTDFKANSLTIRYQGVKFRKTGEAVMDAGRSFQLLDEKYRLERPDKAATAN